MAILKGCDFTKPYLHQYLQVELRQLHMEELASWFIENIRPVGSRLEGYEPLKNHLVSNMALQILWNRLGPESGYSLLIFFTRVDSGCQNLIFIP